MSAAAPVRTGLLGAGRISRAYADALAATPAAELVAVADLEVEAAAALAREQDCAAFPSHRALLEEGGCEAVVVCTPPATHERLAVDALERGVAVLCEKPLALEAASAKRMLCAAEAAGVPFTMATKFRYVADVERAGELIAAGRIGEVVLFEIAFAAAVDMSHRWNADPTVSGGGVLIDNGTHAVDLIRHLAGPILEVQACEGRRLQQLAVEDTAQLFVRTGEGVVGHVDLSWSLDKDQAHFLHVYGSEGLLRVGWQESLLRTGDGQVERFGDGYDKLDAFRRQLEDFAAVIRTGSAPRVSGADALSSVEVIQAAYRSLEEGRWQRVPGAGG